ncbi:hypothetical protein SAMN02745823_03860 [Sporobacter termitidis DSM 10068]|uniref:Uncharacterized protein n=1 Tax=Sporobacter termitidis DSM 10068 TaxID=1123282 RepID=A0A1M5ZKC1_9FIRM|nr:hypothetical protein [Sporobacter termitidis]SHI24737.1 hypothetical protein SAMN02745823_03860 [Sporobacter termitidis DSM 10068]
MANIEIRRIAQQYNIKLWRIAHVLGMTDGNFSRKMRYELPDAEKQKIFNIIKNLSKEEE